MTVRVLFDRLVEDLKCAGLEQAPMEARCLMQAALEWDAAKWLQGNDKILPQPNVMKIREWTEARKRGVPLAWSMPTARM